MTEKVEKYFNNIIRFLKLHPVVRDVKVGRKVITRKRGYIKATATFINGSQLHIREFLDDKLRKMNYAYHYQNNRGKLVFRYDNAPHYMEVETFSHHKHVPNKPKPEDAREKNIINIVEEIAKIIRTH